MHIATIREWRVQFVGGGGVLAPESMLTWSEGAPGICSFDHIWVIMIQVALDCTFKNQTKITQ